MKLNPCPICGHTPLITSHSLERPGGHGYKGAYEYNIACSNTQCPLSRDVPIFSLSDLDRPNYLTKEEVYDHICITWNEETVKINELVLHRGNW